MLCYLRFIFVSIFNLTQLQSSTELAIASVCWAKEETGALSGQLCTVGYETLFYLIKDTQSI